MAERRMFHSGVVGSDAFMDLPAGVQALYFHLGMAADDDGFINSPKQIARKLRRPPRELDMLVEKGFLLDFDGVVVVKHWLLANTLRKDRMKATRYPQIAEKLYIKDNGEYTTQATAGDNLLTTRNESLVAKCLPKGREGKVRKEKINKEKISEPNVAEEKAWEDGVTGTPWDLPASPGATPAAGEIDLSLNYMNGKLGKGVVLLSQAQIEELLEKMGLDSFDYYVEKLADFIKRKDVKVKNHYATILKWWEEDMCL